MDGVILGKTKLIVTGLSGLLGSRLAARAAGSFELINADITEGIDITDRAQIDSVISANADAAAVIHLAAFTNVSAAYAQSGNKEGACYRINVSGTQNITAACEARGLQLIHISTDFVFDGTKDEPYTEEDAPKPIEWYGQTKLWAEEAVRKYSDWTMIRIAFPYVAGPAPRPDLVRGIYNKLAEGQKVTLFTDQIITPTFVDDVVSGLLLLARERPKGELFHLTGSTFLSPYQLGVKIAETFKLDRSLVQPSSLVEYLKKDPRPRQRSIKMSNAKWRRYAAKLGVPPPLTADEGLLRVKECSRS